MEHLTYSFATSDEEIKSALALRMEVFVREQGVPAEEELDEYDKTARHLIVREDDRVIATARILFPVPEEARIGRMAILKPYRRRGIGRRMISLLCEEAQRKRAGKMSLHAQWHARPFYHACGFFDVGEPFQEAGIKHISMQKDL